MRNAWPPAWHNIASNNSRAIGQHRSEQWPANFIYPGITRRSGGDSRSIIVKWSPRYYVLIIWPVMAAWNGAWRIARPVRCSVNGDNKAIAANACTRAVAQNKRGMPGSNDRTRYDINLHIPVPGGGPVVPAAGRPQQWPRRNRLEAQQTPVARCRRPGGETQTAVRI